MPATYAEKFHVNTLGFCFAVAGSRKSEAYGGGSEMSTRRSAECASCFGLLEFNLIT